MKDSESEDNWWEEIMVDREKWLDTGDRRWENIKVDPEKLNRKIETTYHGVTIT